jgi:TolB-like protein
MASIIKSYNYDIFISYRQKDNKGDRWVSEFVDALKDELESTFKEEISVYFDINPHDGLLETHDVDASLKEKLKCLVFIPIISRTYCDPKSFAWEHEFKAFVEQASQDLFGLKVKLPNSNVANRVLPIRIYDLDTNDIKLCESVLGGVLRSVDFIYKSAGVNRPLRANEDHPQDNLNKTYYRDQINKVANSIKEIISAIGQHIPQKEEVEVPKEVFEPISVPQKNSKTTIIVTSGIILALIVLGYFLIPTLSKPKEQLEKSIAVLPFINDSPTDSTTYFINGIMEEVLNNLQKIKDFRVLSRTSTDQYKGPNKLMIPEIAKKLGVNYIVEGSGQKYGNKFVLRVQLIVANNERHLWAKSYDREIQQTTDIISVQSEIAQLIASELKVTITPEEKQQIEKVPTVNLIAYDYYQMGRGEEEKFSFYDLTASTTTFSYILNNPSAKQSLERAEKMYNKALEYDSTFAQAYTGLAGIYWSRNYYKEYFSKDFLDSVFILANRALSFDNQLPDAYYIRGMYFSETGNIKKAFADFDKTLKLNPNYWLAYFGKGTLYGNEVDGIMVIKNLKKAVSLYHGSGLSDVLRYICFTLYPDFNELAKTYNLEAVKLETDSVKFFYWLYMFEGNTQKGLEFLKKGYKIDSTNSQILLGLSDYNGAIRQYKESIKFYKKYFDELKKHEIIIINNMQRIGYYYSKIGLRDSAEYYFNKQIEYCNDAIRLGRPYGGKFAYYDLAGVYAFMGNKINAYENLKIFNQAQRMNSWTAGFIKTDPMFDSIRHEPEFQKIVSDVDAKSQVPHEELRKWLEEQGILK